MTVTGPDPLPSSDLFVAASQWASQELTAGAKTSRGPGALEGSTTVVSCETDDQQAGIGGQRRRGAPVRTGTSANGYIGRQRVQADEATDARSRRPTSAHGSRRPRRCTPRAARAPTTLSSPHPARRRAPTARHSVQRRVSDPLGVGGRHRPEDGWRSEHRGHHQGERPRPGLRRARPAARPGPPEVVRQNQTSAGPPAAPPRHTADARRPPPPRVAAFVVNGVAVRGGCSAGRSRRRSRRRCTRTHPRAS